MNQTRVAVIIAIAVVLAIEIWGAYLYVKPRLTGYVVPEHFGKTLSSLRDLGGSLLTTGDNNDNDFLEHDQTSSQDTSSSNLLSNVQPDKPTEPWVWTPQPNALTWRHGTFCEDFLENTFSDVTPVCNSVMSSKDDIQCLGGSHAKGHLATCVINHMVVDPKKMQRTMINADKCYIKDSASIWLMDESYCPHPTMSHLVQTMEGGDYVKLFVNELIRVQRRPPSACQNWVNKTVFFFGSHEHHIYFRVLAWYNLHKSLLDNKATPGDFFILRISAGDRYLFPEYERKLFPELITLDEFTDQITCFKKVVLVPKTYASIMFQCKMLNEVRGRCLDCNGKGLHGTSIATFRTRVLNACGIQDIDPKEKKERKLVVILRKPYLRHGEDQLSHFERVLGNANELVDRLKTSFPSTTVTAIHMEDLSICEQIRYAHDADVLMGVHGAGLVHLWWLQDEALMFELEPYYQVGNPSFKVLAQISGKSYHSFSIQGSMREVTVDVDGIISTLKSKYHLS